MKKEFPQLIKETKLPQVLLGKTKIFMKMKALNFVEGMYNLKIKKFKTAASKVQQMYYRGKIK